jgi:hypothetical protein
MITRIRKEQISSGSAPNTYVLTADGSGNTDWLAQTSGSGTSGSGGIPEAPIDGLIYGRKDAAWTEVISGSGTSGSQVVPLTTGSAPNRYFNGYSAITGSFTTGSFVVPVAKAPVTNFYLTGYDDVSGSFSSGSVVGGTSGSGSTTYSVVEYIDQTGGTGDTYGILSGSVNGSNKTFVTSQNKYYTGTLKIYRNGQLQTQGSGSSGDWSETASGSGVFDFYVAPLTGDQLTAIYSITAAVSGSSGGSSTLTGLTDVAISGSQTNGQLLAWSSGSSKWVDTIYDRGVLQLLTRRTAVNAEDDHFNGSALDGKWTSINTTGTPDFTTFPGWMGFISGSGTVASALVQPISGSGNWTIETEFMTMNDYVVGYHYTGLMLSSGSALQCMYSYGQNNALANYVLLSQKWVNYSYNAGISSLASTTVLGQDHLFLRIVKVGTVYNFDYSSTGKTWRRHYVNSSLGFVPTFFGLMVNNVGSSEPSYFNYFLKY